MIGDLGGATRHLLSREGVSPPRSPCPGGTACISLDWKGPQDPSPLHSCCLLSLPLVTAPVSFKVQKWGDGRKGEGQAEGSPVWMGQEQ